MFPFNGKTTQSTARLKKAAFGREKESEKQRGKFRRNLVFFVVNRLEYLRKDIYQNYGRLKILPPNISNSNPKNLKMFPYKEKVSYEM